MQKEIKKIATQENGNKQKQNSVQQVFFGPKQLKTSFFGPNSQWRTNEISAKQDSEIAGPLCTQAKSLYSF